MVQYQRYNLLKKGGDEETGTLVGLYYRRTRPKLVSLFFLSLVSCTVIVLPHLFTTSSSLSHLFFADSFSIQNECLAGIITAKSPLCPTISNGGIRCDRSHFRSDICCMKGDIRTHSPSSSIFLYASENSNGFFTYVSSLVYDGEKDQADELQHESIKPYTRKWETSVMDMIDELDLISKRSKSGVHHPCDVVHNVPAVIFSTGGYTGNVYHDINDGILPLYITSQHFNRKVVFMILDYHNWWVTKYGDILSQLSDHPIIDFIGDDRTHCFTEAIAGLRIHDELTVDSMLLGSNKSIVDFRNLLDRAYWPRIKSLIQEGERDKVQYQVRKPKLVILSRNGSRGIINEDLVVKTSEEIGFQVHVLRPERTTELAKLYMSLNSSDVLVGVHGAALTHFLFMQPGSVFIQIIPLGTDWAAETYYGEPARKLGLKYIGYKITCRESSLFHEYDEDDPVLINPSSLTKKGWEYTKKIYLEDQTLSLDLPRFRKSLVRAYGYVTGMNPPESL